MLIAATNLNRFAIVYELATVFVKKAVKRFDLKKLYEEIAVPSNFSTDEYGQMAFNFSS